MEYGIDATVAIKKELEQIVEYEVFVPVDREYKDVDYMRTHDAAWECLGTEEQERVVRELEERLQREAEAAARV